MLHIKIDNFNNYDDESLCCEYENCKREFKSKRNLVDHCRGHHQGKKPHPCTFQGCGKSFLRPAHLIIHNRIHTGEKPFICEHPGCGKKWNQKSALKQHLRSHTGEKPFGCTVKGCNKRFSTSSSCKRHVTTHYNRDYENKMTKEWSSFSPISSPISSPGSPMLSSSSEEEQDCNVQPFRVFRSVVMEPKRMDVNFLLNE